MQIKISFAVAYDFNQYMQYVHRPGPSQPRRSTHRAGALQTNGGWTTSRSILKIPLAFHSQSFV